MNKLAPTLWLRDEKLVLASRSRARIAMLVNAGIPIEVVPADVDERAIEGNLGGPSGPAELAVLLAEAKALAVSLKMPNRLVLGSDQVLDLDGEVCAKVADRAEAAARLRQMSGRSHILHSAFCLARNGCVVHSAVSAAELWMRSLSRDFIETYLDTAGPDVFDSVAVYEVEGLGIQMFDRIDGDWFSIQGLPLNQVIQFLQNEGWLLR